MPGPCFNDIFLLVMLYSRIRKGRDNIMCLLSGEFAAAKRLEARGLIVFDPSQPRERRSHCQITDKGIKMVHRFAALIKKQRRC